MLPESSIKDLNISFLRFYRFLCNNLFSKKITCGIKQAGSSYSKDFSY